MAELTDIITSKVRIKILELFYSNLGEMYHVRGIVREIKEEINAVRRELGKLESVGILKKEEDVDILVVGDVVLPELAALIRLEESKKNREINYTVMSREEFDFRKKRRDPFLLGILAGSRVMIIGDEEDLGGYPSSLQFPPPTRRI